VPADPIELQALEAVRARLAVIDGSGDWHTAAGQSVYLGRALDPDLDALPALVVGFDEAGAVASPEPTSGLLRWTLPLVVEGWVRASDEDPFADTIRLARDIKAALYRTDDLALLEADTDDLEITRVEHGFTEFGSEYAVALVHFTVTCTERFAG